MRALGLMIFCIAPAILFGQTMAPAAAQHAVAAPAAVVASVDDDARTPLTPEQKIRRRALRLIEPVTLVSTALSAGIEQWRDVPHAWGQGAEGYAIRFASSEGFTAAHNGVALSFDLAFHLDPRYRRKPGARIGPRVWNAVSQTFIANRDSGGTMINVSEIGGNFGAGFLSNTWHPAGYNSPEDAVTRGMLGLAFHTARNVVREFLPDVLHRGRHS